MVRYIEGKGRCSPTPSHAALHIFFCFYYIGFPKKVEGKVWSFIARTCGEIMSIDRCGSRLVLARTLTLFCCVSASTLIFPYEIKISYGKQNGYAGHPLVHYQENSHIELHHGFHFPVYLLSIRCQVYLSGPTTILFFLAQSPTSKKS